MPTIVSLVFFAIALLFALIWIFCGVFVEWDDALREREEDLHERCDRIESELRERISRK